MGFICDGLSLLFVLILFIFHSSLIKSNPKKVTLHINNMLIIVYIAIQAKQISTCLFNFIVALPEQFSAGLCFEQFDVIYIRDCQVREDFSFTCCLILCEMQVFFTL